MAGRPTSALWGIGPRMERRLAELGLVTVADLAAADPADLAERFGPTMGPWYGRLAHGAGGTGVSSDPRLPRSRSRETTFQDDLTQRSEIRSHVAELARELTLEAAAHGRLVVQVAVKVRFAPFFTRVRSMKLSH